MNLRHSYLIALLLLLLSMPGCRAREPETVALSGMVYNYSQEGYVRVKINGHLVGATAEKVDPGGVSGGGVTCWCRLPIGISQIEVELEPSTSDGYKTTATIEKWWPDLAHYGVIHILPERKVVIEVRSVHTWPRKDLMENQLKFMGTKRVHNYTGPMNEGPMERTDGVN